MGSWRRYLKSHNIHHNVRMFYYFVHHTMKTQVRVKGVQRRGVCLLSCEDVISGGLLPAVQQQ